MSNESIQYKGTHLPHLCAETADKRNKSHWIYFILDMLMHRWEVTGIINYVLLKELLPDLLECQMHVWINTYNCYLKGFDSKETSVYYYFFSEPCQSQGIDIAVWNTHCSVTQGK